MRILITGGAGFLGSHLCDLFITQGHEVLCSDNCLTGRPENVAHLLGYERFRFVKYDVCDYLLAGTRNVRYCSERAYGHA
jgi:dTDP-glucose 4,6-dehydratase